MWAVSGNSSDGECFKLDKQKNLPINQNLSLVYFSPAKFQLVSCNLLVAMIWHTTYTHKLPKLCSATLNKNECIDCLPKVAAVVESWLLCRGGH